MTEQKGQGTGDRGQGSEKKPKARAKAKAKPKTEPKPESKPESKPVCVSCSRQLTELRGPGTELCLSCYFERAKQELGDSPLVPERLTLLAAIAFGSELAKIWLTGGIWQEMQKRSPDALAKAVELAKQLEVGTRNGEPGRREMDDESR